ncbi:MAG: Ldh family oxidoreductase [Chlamydiae bacterium]|nr:Ldh family oxidoreductase [Chlamydiota bacterium]
MRIDPKILREALVSELILYNISKEDAEFIADSFVTADLKGYSQHGSIRLLQLTEGLKNGTINPKYEVEVMKDNEIITVIDAKRSIGQVTARDAVNISIKKAQNFGVGISGVINASHIGCLSFYTEIAAKNNCICIGMTTSSPAVSFNGGTKKIMGTNPIAYSIPGKASDIHADFSTSKVSRGVVMEKIARGENVPLGWCADKNGQAITNPNVINEGGSLLPFDNGAKASMLSLLISILAGPFIGGVNNINVTGTRYMELPPNKGDFFITFHIPHFTEVSDFYKKMDELKDTIEENNDSIFHLPGRGSAAHYQENLKTGVEIDKEIFSLILNHIHKEKKCQKKMNI